MQVSFYALRAASGAFTEHPIDPGGPSPTWLPPLLSLYAAAQQLDPVVQHHVTPRTIFHQDLLSSFAAIGPALTKGLVSAPPDQCRGLIDLILSQAVTAINSSSMEMTDGAGFEQEEEESGESVVEAATDAVRAMLSGPSEVQNIALAAGALSSIDRMLLALLTPAKRQNIGARKACRHLFVAVVHAVHAADSGASSAALGILQARAFDPLVEAASQAAAHITSSGAASRSGLLTSLHASLADVQSILNTLESFEDLGLHDRHPAARAAVEGAVAACLTAWSEIGK